VLDEPHLHLRELGLLDLGIDNRLSSGGDLPICVGVFILEVVQPLGDVLRDLVGGVAKASHRIPFPSLLATMLKTLFGTSVSRS
jgi:hypothetical protein